LRLISEEVPDQPEISFEGVARQALVIRAMIIMENI